MGNLKDYIKSEIESFINGNDSVITECCSTERFGEAELSDRIERGDKRISGRELAHLVGCGGVYDEASFNRKLKAGIDDPDIVLVDETEQ